MRLLDAHRWLSLLTVLLVMPAAAQQEQPADPVNAAPANAAATAFVKSMTPGSQHTFLSGQEGEWTAKFWVFASPDIPPIEGAGSIQRKMILGGRVLQEEITATLMGMPFHGLGHVGHDNVTGRYWASSFDNFSTGVTTLEGTIDEATGKATFEGWTPEPSVGQRVPMRLEIYYEDGKQVTETYVQPPGQEMTLRIKTVYERQ